MVRNHDLLGATDAERPGAEEVGVLPFRILPRSRARYGCQSCSSTTLETRGRWQCQMLCYTHSLARRMKEHTSFGPLGTPRTPAFPARKLDGLLRALGDRACHRLLAVLADAAPTEIAAACASSTAFLLEAENAAIQPLPGCAGILLKGNPTQSFGASPGALP
jgi:hypothetical protein